MTVNEGVLNWNSEIVKDSNFIVIPAGDYPFTVVSVEKGQHEPKPGGKLPACPRAIVKIKIDQIVDPTSTVQIDHYLFLHSMMEAGLSEFFASIGMKEKDKPMTLDFDNIIGKKGVATLKIDTYQGNEKNDIARLIPSYEVNKPQATAAISDMPTW